VLPLGQASEDDPLADKFMLAHGHTADTPMLTRLVSPVDVDPLYWQYATEIAASVAADLIGPNVRFHHSKLNFKWSGERVSLTSAVSSLEVRLEERAL
jgi:hypothetical protein